MTSYSNPFRQEWQALVGAALVGTGRTPYTSRVLPGELGALLASWSGEPAEQRLLHTAAALGLYLDAGALPAKTDAQAGEPCLPDELPACSPQAAWRLESLPGSSYANLLVEWLQVAAASGVRAAEETLPALFEAAKPAGGRVNFELVTAILPAAGRRGEWLARQNPEWRFLAYAYLPGTRPRDDDLLRAWETGTRLERRLLLRSLRSITPATGLALIEKTWQEDGSDDRVAFLNDMEIGLSAGDEPFLEKVLDERAKGVRRVAVDLLAHLTNSRLVQRMIARGSDLLRLESGRWPLRKARLELNPPTRPDAGLNRDGADLVSGQGMGEQAAWSLAILNCIPPDTWSRAFDKSPEELIELAEQSEWKDLLWQGWPAAAYNAGDAAWAESLLRKIPGRSELLPVLSNEQAERLFLSYLEPRFRLDAMGWLRRYGRAWSASLTRSVVARLPDYFHALAAARTQSNFPEIMKEFAGWMDPALTEEITRSLSSRPSGELGIFWAQGIEALTERLEFRRQMIEEINQNEPTAE